MLLYVSWTGEGKWEFLPGESDKARQLPGHALRWCFVRATAQEVDDVRALSGRQGVIFGAQKVILAWRVQRVEDRCQIYTQQSEQQAYQLSLGR